MTYARGTDVTVDRSQVEVVRILQRYDVEEYAFGATRGTVGLSFTMRGTPVRISLPVPPKPPADEKVRSGNGRWVSTTPRWEQEVRETWRALALVLKANLELVERRAVTVEQAFMAFLVTIDGRTLGDLVLPAYERSLSDGRLLELEA